MIENYPWPFSCAQTPYTRIDTQLANLLDCEKKLISIDVKNDALDTLRKRQNALFVAFIKGMKVEKKTGECYIYID